MKTNGIVRRVDHLGWMVIPKETCRTVGIVEGMPLEITMLLDVQCGDGDLGEENKIMTRYWVNYETDAVTTTQEKEMPAPWKEVNSQEYERAYNRAWKIAMDYGIWHC